MSQTPPIPLDLAGAITCYCDAMRKLQTSWGTARKLDSRIAAAIREENMAGIAVLEIVWRHYGNGAPGQ